MQHFDDALRFIGVSTAREIIDSPAGRKAGLSIASFPGDIDEWTAWNQNGIIFFYRASGADPDEGLGWTRGYLDTATGEVAISPLPASSTYGPLYQDVHRRAAQVSACP